MPDHFHARKSAVSKEYRYRLVRGRTLSPLDSPMAVGVSPEIDLAAIEEATSLLIGRHDFTAFASSGGGHGQPSRRISSARWVIAGDVLEFRIVGDGFLRGMVRSIVGTLLEVGHSRMTAAEIGRLLQGASRDAAGPTAAARGLVLEAVHYAAGKGLPEAFPGTVDVLG
jgi:tRNA pseudouridine38-40 synthase